MRAFLAGRIDLAQAEAVLGLIDAKTDSRFKAALRQMAGGISNTLDHVRAEIVELLALLEAGLDFAEEDIEFISPTDFHQRSRRIIQAMGEIAHKIRSRNVGGSIPRVALVGPPNAGKSSLFNALVGTDAAITSDTAGTTRDIVAANVSIANITIEFVDTAGHEELSSTDALHQQMEQQRAAASQSADLILRCLDLSQPMKPTDTDSSAACIMVGTKFDQVDGASIPPGLIATSSLTGYGLEELKQQIVDCLNSASSSDELTPATSTRCLTAIEAADAAMHSAILAFEHQGEELVAAELRLATAQLAEVVGAVYTDDLLDVIFTRFCIGK